jgi:hypothetical protein
LQPDLLKERTEEIRWPIPLGEKWRLAALEIQWVLQRRKGRCRPKNSGWENVYYPRSKAGLILHLDRLGLRTAMPVAILDLLPDWHP